MAFLESLKKLTERLENEKSERFTTSIDNADNVPDEFYQVLSNEEVNVRFCPNWKYTLSDNLDAELKSAVKRFASLLHKLRIVVITFHQGKIIIEKPQPEPTPYPDGVHPCFGMIVRRFYTGEKINRDCFPNDINEKTKTWLKSVGLSESIHFPERPSYIQEAHKKNKQSKKIDDKLFEGAMSEALDEKCVLC